MSEETGYAYQKGDHVFVYDYKVKGWHQGIVRKYVPANGKFLEPAYSVGIRKLKKVTRNRKPVFTMVKGPTFFATNGNIKHLDILPEFDVGQRVFNKKNGHPILIMQMLEFSKTCPIYLVFDLQDRKKHQLSETNIAEKLA